MCRELADGKKPHQGPPLAHGHTPDTEPREFLKYFRGNEIAAAIGAKLARPEQPVYAMVGDGSYMMLHS
ncbi:thiamine pyrophosphate-dependent enzyme, partial [Enterobacter asburiae]